MSNPLGLPPPTTGVPVSQMFPTTADGYTLWLHDVLVHSANLDADAIVEAVEHAIDVNSYDDILPYLPNLVESQARFQAAGSELYEVQIWIKPATLPGAVHYRIIYVHSTATTAFIEDMLAILRVLAIVGIAVALIFFWQSFTQKLKDICSNSALGDYCHPAQSIGHEMMLITLFGAGVSFAVWLASNSISKHETGHGIAPPGPPPITTPGFTAGQSTTVKAGPISSTSEAGLRKEQVQGSTPEAYRPPRESGAEPPHHTVRPTPPRNRPGFHG